MNSTLKKIIKRGIRLAFDKAPQASDFLWGRVRRIILRKEIKAYDGKGKSKNGGHKSVVFFSHNRCASMMLNRRLLDLLEGVDLERIDYQRLVHPLPEKEREVFQWDREGHLQRGRFKGVGYYYGPFRYYVDIPKLNTFNTVLVLRDPRDVITSRYFSEAFAHVALDSKFHEHTKAVREMDVDTFVREFAPDVEAHYRNFMENFEMLKGGVVWRYEELIADFAGFLAHVNDAFELGHDKRYIASIASKESFTVQSEDKFAHKRSVSAGAYLKKLKPETVVYLNELFADVLVFFDWEADVLTSKQ